MLINTFLLLISTLLAFANAQCPSYWWPMSTASRSVNFLSEVMVGDNAYVVVGTTVTAATFATNDRIGANSFRSILFPAAVNIQLAADTYFCTGSFTISAWVNPAAVNAIIQFLDARDNNALGVTFSMTAGALLSLQVNAQTAITGATQLTAAWHFVAVTYSGAGTTPNFFTAVTNVGTTTAVAGSGAIGTAPSCTVLTRTMVSGTGTLTTAAAFAMNDLKIYNFALSNAQINTRFSAELGKL